MQNQNSPDDQKLSPDPDQREQLSDEMPDDKPPFMQSVIEMSEEVENASSMGTIPNGSGDRWIPEEAPPNNQTDSDPNT